MPPALFSLCRSPYQPLQGLQCQNWTKLQAAGNIPALEGPEVLSTPYRFVCNILEFTDPVIPRQRDLGTRRINMNHRIFFASLAPSRFAATIVPAPRFGDASIVPSEPCRILMPPVSASRGGR
jgi:hypothetical protein